MESLKSIMSFLTDIEADRSESILTLKGKRSDVRDTTSVREDGKGKGFPREVNLGKWDKPFNTERLNKELEKAKGLIVMVFRKGHCFVFAHGDITPREFAEAFGGTMQRTFGIEARVGMRKVKRRDSRRMYSG